MKKSLKAIKSWYGHFIFFGLILGILGEASAIALTPNSIQSQLITQTSQVNVQSTGSTFNLAQINRFAEKRDCYFAEDLIRVYNERGEHLFNLRENQRIRLEGENRIFEDTILVEIETRNGYEYGHIYKDEPLRPCDQPRQNSNRTRDRIRSGSLNTPRPNSTLSCLEIKTVIDLHTESNSRSTRLRRLQPRERVIPTPGEEKGNWFHVRAEDNLTGWINIEQQEDVSICL